MLQNFTRVIKSYSVFVIRFKSKDIARKYALFRRKLPYRITTGISEINRI